MSSNKYPSIFSCQVEAIVYLYNNQINARALIGQSAVGYCAGKPREKSRVSELLYKSNRPQVSMGYMLINHSPAPRGLQILLVFYQHPNTPRKPYITRCGSWFTNSSRVLPTSRVVYLSNRPQVSLVYKLINHAGCW